jgi:adenosylhomocysteinase
VSDSKEDRADRGEERIGWVRSRMALLGEVRERFAAEQPFVGRTIGVALHTEPKTAVLLETLAAGGARIVGTGNHGSTQDDVVAALGRRGITIFGRRDDTLDDHMRDLGRTLDAHPDVLLDNGADLALMALERGRAGELIGGTEETTSGGFRLREHESCGVPFPVIVINDSPLKAIAENRHAVGQSTVESFLRRCPSRSASCSRCSSVRRDAA